MEAGQEYVERDGGGAELASDVGDHLDVEKLVALGFEVMEEVVEGDFRGVVRSMEHGFPGEEATDGDTIYPADECAGLPTLHAVRVSGLMKVDVGVNEF